MFMLFSSFELGARVGKSIGDVVAYGGARFPETGLRDTSHTRRPSRSPCYPFSTLVFLAGQHGTIGLKSPNPGVLGFGEAYPALGDSLSHLGNAQELPMGTPYTLRLLTRLCPCQ